MKEIGWSNSKAQRIARSQNPPQFENAKKKGYSWVMKELWDAADFRHSDLTSQNLREKAARLEKCMGGVRILITESVGFLYAYKGKTF